MSTRAMASVELHRRLGFEEVTRDFSFPGLTFEGGKGILFRAPITRTDRLEHAAR
jgi:hypothetical protein